MAVEHLKDAYVMTGRTANPVDYPDPGLSGGVVRKASFKVEMTAAASDTSTYLIARLPSSARICGISHISWDDLDAAGSPTLDIGVFNPSDRTSNTITDDVDAINDGLAAQTLTTQTPLIKTIDNYGLQLWDFVNGQTTDPGGELDIKITLDDADASLGGTIAGEIYYVCN